MPDAIRTDDGAGTRRNTMCFLTFDLFIGRWQGETLVIDTIAFEPDPSGIALNVPASPGKHTVERLTLTAERTRLRYQITVEDPVYLLGPATLTQQWDHRPDLEFSQNTGACDPEVADRYREHVPK